MFEKIRNCLTQLALYSAMFVLMDLGLYLENEICSLVGLLCAISLILNFSTVEELCKIIMRKLKKFKDDIS